MWSGNRKCSDNLWWDLESDGKLTISGNGEMTEHPWASHLGYSGVTTYIQTVEVKDGVKSIDSSTFNMGFYLKSVSLPDSVTKIGDCAFMD